MLLRNEMIRRGIPILAVVAVLAAAGVCAAAQVTITTNDLPISYYQPGPSDPLFQSVLDVVISNITWAKEGTVSLLESDGIILSDLISFINLVNGAQILVDSDPDQDQSPGGGGGGGFSQQFVKDGSTLSVSVPTTGGGVIQVDLLPEGGEYSNAGPLALLGEGTELYIGKVVPMPATALLLVTGALGLSVARRRGRD